MRAALTILRWGLDQPRPEGLLPVDGFEPWARRVRDPLYTLTGEDVWRSSKELEARDASRQDVADFLRAVHETLGDQPFTATEIMSYGFDTAIGQALRGLPNRAGASISGLGRWLSANAERDLPGGLRLARGPARKPWQVVPAPR